MRKLWKNGARRLLALVCAAALGRVHGGRLQPSNDVTSGVGSTDFPVTVNDVTISQKPEGVAVLSANLADVVLALNYELPLKARTADCLQRRPRSAARGGGGRLRFHERGGRDRSPCRTGRPRRSSRTRPLRPGVTLLGIAPATSREDLTRLYAQVGAALNGGVTGYEKGQKTASNVCITIDDVARVIPETSTPRVACYLTDASAAR